MKKTLKKSNVSDLLYKCLTNAAVNTGNRCYLFSWQEPKVPQCLLNKEAEKSVKQQ